MADYVLESRSKAGAYLATLPYRNLQGEFWRNKADQIRFEVPLYNTGLTRTNFFPAKTEVWVIRNGAKVFVGPLWDATPSSDNGTISCAAEGIESYLEGRRIKEDVKYTGARSATAWDLINGAQTGTDAALGIIQGTINTAGNFTIEWMKNDGEYISDAMETLSKGNEGFDWEIDVNRAFNLYYPRPAVASRVKLEWPTTIKRYSVQMLGKFEANDVFVKGKDDLRSQPVIDTSKRAEYGLRQVTISATDLETLDQANDYGEQVLNLRRDIREIPSVVLNTDLVNPFNGDIWFGQTAPVVISDGWVQYDQVMRLNGFQLSVGKQGNETFNLYMSDLREVA